EELLIGQITASETIELVEVDNVPQPINNYVKDWHAPIGIELVYYAPNIGYEVMLENGFCIFFDNDGHHLNHGGMHDDGGNHHNSGYYCMTGDTLDIDALPLDIVNYINDNYPGEGIQTVILKPSGKLFVELDSGLILFFHPDGEFLQECEFPHGQGDGMHQHDHMDFGDNSWHCGGGGMGGHQGGAGGQHGGMGGNGGGGNNNQGNEEGPCWGGTGISINDLPQLIQDYVETNYPDETIEFAMQTFNSNYFLRLSDCIRIVFDEDGNLIFDSGN
ncbi:MAG: hypothetical protein HKN68_08185, partial [Saprospiraceae bacterium]|nr:hypothetical protein [Saprospiraceae bacterium]